MPNRTVGPFLALSSIETTYVERAFSDEATGDDTDYLLVCMDALRDCLINEGCRCNGNKDGTERDPDWGADISELICRTMPHNITVIDGNGGVLEQSVSVKLDTLRAEIDSNGEICAWLYQED